MNTSVDMHFSSCLLSRDFIAFKKDELQTVDNIYVKQVVTRNEVD